MDGVREEIDLLRLPRTQPFSVVIDSLPIARSFNLLGENDWVRCQIEGLGGDHGSSLMVVMVLADDIVGQPRENHFRTRQADQSHDGFQSLTVPPSLQGMEYVCARSIRAMQKPGIGNAIRGERTAGLHLANFR